ncbi:MAG: nuclear transport factor 2 family protein [Desulfobaccales bacterium]
MRPNSVFKISLGPPGAARVVILLLMACLTPCLGWVDVKQAAGAEEQVLARLISEYFSSWSKPDMQAYKNCFHAQASVYFIDASGNPHKYSLEEFIAQQEKAHLAATAPMTEKPTQSTIEVRGRTAQALVRWELLKSGTTATGTDYFTFLKTAAGWKILTLVFEQDKKR